MNNRGFTLIELLVTIAVIIIMATIAIPRFSSIVERNRLAAEYNVLLTGLHFARSEAVKRRSVVTVEISTESGEWGMDVKVGTDVLRSFSSTNGSVSVNDGSLGKVQFNGLGRRVPDSCAFALPSCSISVGDQEIEINAAGNIMRPSS